MRQLSVTPKFSLSLMKQLEKCCQGTSLSHFLDLWPMKSPVSRRDIEESMEIQLWRWWCSNRQRARLHSEKSKEFLTRITRTLIRVQTASAYHDTIQEMKDFVPKKKVKDQRGFLISWIQWWDDGTSHVFPAFARKSAPATNLAEVIHSKRNTTGGVHLSLVDTAPDNIKDSLVLERQFKAHEAGNFHEGSGPSVSTMAARSFQAQKKCAEMYTRDLNEEDEPSDLSTRADALRTYI